LRAGSRRRAESPAANRFAPAPAESPAAEILVRSGQRRKV